MPTRLLVVLAVAALARPAAAAEVNPDHLRRGLIATHRDAARCTRSASSRAAGVMSFCSMRSSPSRAAGGSAGDVSTGCRTGTRVRVFVVAVLTATSFSKDRTTSVAAARRIGTPPSRAGKSAFRRARRAPASPVRLRRDAARRRA